MAISTIVFWKKKMRIGYYTRSYFGFDLKYLLNALVTRVLLRYFHSFFKSNFRHYTHLKTLRPSVVSMEGRNISSPFIRIGNFTSKYKNVQPLFLFHSSVYFQANGSEILSSISTVVESVTSTLDNGRIRAIIFHYNFLTRLGAFFASYTPEKKLAYLLISKRGIWMP